MYRKPSNSERFLPYTSYHYSSHKLAAINSWTYRALTHCSTNSLLNQELNYLRAVVFKAEQLPPNIINCEISKVVRNYYSNPTIPTDDAASTQPFVTISIPFVGKLFPQL